MTSTSPSEHSSTRTHSANSRRPSSRPGRGKAAGRRSSSSRQESKELTRQALLRAALKLLSRHSFDSISLREVTREAGVSPTAFYRHFDDMEELGLVLVEDALGTLRQMIREVRSVSDGLSLSLTKSLDTVVEFTDDHKAHLRFIARERYGGIRRLRRTIRRELQLFKDELAIDLADFPGLQEWSIDDRRVLAGLLVEAMVQMVAELLDARDEERDEIITQTMRQVRLGLLGVPNWRPESQRQSTR